ncbi:MAG: NAD-dependent epimerase/dehydratase family protein [Bacteroidia bacterium]
MSSSKNSVLVIGASGQIGTELVSRLSEIHGNSSVVATDLKPPTEEMNCPFEELNVLDTERLSEIFSKYKISEVYLLAAMLSATGEKHPMKAWDLNMNGLFNLLEAAKEKRFSKLYWPSSIAVFGPSTPKENTPQKTITEPSTVYGISKLAGERWCEYYHLKYGVDVRSLRYPGLIGWKSSPGGGTTDYAVHIFHEALQKGEYTSFLSAKTSLPMMYMSDGIEATVKIMHAESESIKVRSSYNLSGMSFSPDEIAQEIKKHIPEFKMDYAPDFRQEIADSWPSSIDDSEARKDWNWKPSYDLSGMTEDMLTNLKRLNSTAAL